MSFAPEVVRSGHSHRMIKFSSRGWEDYLYWQAHDKALLKRTNQLIRDIERTPFSGIGKPEPLKHQLTGFWSRRIDGTHRLVYAVENDTILIAQCRDHY
jgi:toxin YoeB